MGRYASRRRGAGAAALSILIWAFGASRAVGAGDGAPAQAAAPAPARSAIWGGVYSQAQARRGLLEYGRSCEHCHGASLTGNPTDEVPALTADAFLFHWRGRSVQDLHARIRKAMPADAPGSLGAGAYLDLVAYLLEANGFPPGSEELDPGRLGALVIETASPSQP